LINSNVAGGAYLLFLHARKRVPWITAGCTLMFQGYIDVMLLAVLSLLAIALVPTSPIRPGRDFAAGVLGAGCLIASFWLLWGARLNHGTWLRWLYERPSMASFRMARPAARHQAPDLSGGRLRTIRTVSQFSYSGPASAGGGTDAVDRSDRKFAFLTRGNRNHSARVHNRLRRICRQKRSVRAVPRGQRL
jgi:hypothetical protein